MTATMDVVPELIAQWREKRISGTALMRGLVSYEQWQVRISEEAMATALAQNSLPSLQISRDPAGKLCLLLFSSNAAYARFAKAQPEQQHFLTTRGTVLFADPMEGIERIQVDPLSPYDIFYDQTHFERLRETARAIEVEEMLSALRQGQGGDRAFAMVREYKTYSVAVAMRDGRPTLVMAPDSNGRTLAAAFTADDAYDAFAAEHGVDAQQMQIEGAALFEMFSRMSIDGFVFNCCGPVKPVAFAQPAAKVFLETGRS